MSKTAIGVRVLRRCRQAWCGRLLTALAVLALSTTALYTTAAQAAAAAPSAAAAPPAASTVASTTPIVDRTTFDHLTTGFELIGQHRDLPCESCHVNAIFKGTPKDCGSCHGVGTQVKATAKPTNHILTSNRCESCHTSVAWNPAVNFDHAEVKGGCSSCHNNNQAQGKGLNHIETTLECNFCHSTIGWAGAVYNHPAVTTGCVTCHDVMGSAKSMPVTHVPIATAGCESCHTPTYYLSFAFSNVSGTAQPSMVHTAGGLEVANCIACHEAGAATLGAPPTKLRPALKASGSAHTPTGQCSACHMNYTSFKGATDYPGNHIPLPNGGSSVCTTCHMDPANFLTYTMDHTVVTSETCATCHAAGLSFAGIAPPALAVMPGNHVASGTAACETCHLASSTAVGGFKFTNASGTAPAAMVHSAVPGLACASCHAAGKTDVGVPATMVTPGNHVPIGTAACEGCHLPSSTAAGGFKLPSNISGSAPPAMVHSAVAGVACSTCHATGKTDIGVPATQTPPNNHVPFGTASCESCHLAGSTATGGFKLPSNVSGSAPPAMVHSAVVGVACATCHAIGKTDVGVPATVTPATPPTNHIPIGTAACEGCHLASSTATGGFRFNNVSGLAPPAMVHTLVTAIACSACHERGLTWSGSPTTVLRPLNLADGVTPHVQTGECSDCHASTVTFKGTTNFPGNHIPMPNGSSTTCSLCHSNPANFLVYTMGTTGHAVVTSESCDLCHGAGKSFAGMAPPALVLPPGNHIPFGAAKCDSCHAGSNFTQPGGFKFTNVSGTAPAAMVHAAVPGMACATCHAAGKTDIGVPATMVLPAKHVPVGAVPCESCHLSSSTATGGFKFTNVSGTAPSSMVHSAVAGVACATCHALGKSDVGVPATMVLPGNHVPVGAVACEGCHLSSSTATGGFKFTNKTGTAPSAMVHSQVTSTVCSTCHEKGMTDVGVPATVVRPINEIPGNTTSPLHVTAGECSTCHFNTVSFLGASNLPGNHIPLPTGAVNCSTCHTNTATYSTYVMGTAGHAAVAAEACAVCHTAGLSFANMAPPTLVQPPTAHVPFGTVACEKCHSNTTFTQPGGFKFTNLSGTAPASMVHLAVPGVACATCHAIGKTDVGVPATVTPPGNHVPFGTVACEKCHLSTSTATGGFKFPNVSGTAPSAMVHSAVAGVTCATCHATGKIWAGTPATMLPPSNHIPFGTAACEGCHLASSTATGGFKFTNKTSTAPAAMVHSLVTSIVCSTCHEKGLSWAGTPATVLRPIYETGNSGALHVVAGECSSCHLNTVSFLGAVNYPPNHIPLPKGSASTCSICHTTGNYSAAVMLTPGHAVVTGTACAVCHAYGLTFAGTIQPTHPPAGATGHIPSNPPNGTANFACELCHSPTVFTSFAGTVMKHAVTKSMQCQSCHERGMVWKVNANAYGNRGVIWYRTPIGDHNGRGAAPNDCSNCHNSRDKHALRRASASATMRTATVSGAGAGPGGVRGGAATFNHVRVANVACASCHNQVNATGKPADHMTVADNCASCHTTLAWVPVLRVDHTQVKGSCVSCHNKLVAKGKGNAHIVSGDDCETCHTTIAWTPARFDHAGVAAHTCVDCHNGLRAEGLRVDHIPTRGAQCDTCHGTLGWKPAKLDHATLTTNCVSCHDNKIALGVTTSHMTLKRDCATCHSYPDWAALHFKHSTGKYPGEHKLALACTSCHTSNTDQIRWLAAGEAGSCAGCHTKDFKADLHPKTSGGLKYTASELHDCGGACHVYSDATGSTVVKSLPGPYHRVSDATFKH